MQPKEKFYIVKIEKLKTSYLKYLLKNKTCIVFGSLYLLISIILLFQPLFNYLGFEFAAVIGLCSSIISASYTYIIFKEAINKPKKEKLGYILLICLKKNIVLLIIPFLLALMSILFVKNCSVVNGILFFILIPLVSVIYSVSFSLFIYTLFHKYKLLILFTLFFFIIVVSVSDYFLKPQLFVYNPFIGFFPGLVYDEELYISSSLILYRLSMLIQSIIFISAANISYQIQKDLPLKKKIIKFQYILSLPTMILFALLIIFHVFKNELGIAGDKEYVISSLGKTYKTENFIIYYSDKNIDDDKIMIIAKQHEFYFKKICKQLQISDRDKIESFIYPDAETKYSLIGAKYTIVSKPWLKQIHLNEDTYEQVLKHELVHVIAGEFGIPVLKIGRSAALIEGLAMAIEWDWGYRTLHQYSAGIVELLPQIKLENILSTTNFISTSPSISYVLSGSFIKYIIETYGVQKIKELYSSANWEKATGKDQETLIEDWKTYITSRYYSKEDSTIINYTFKRQAIFHKVCARVVANLNEKARNMFINKNFLEAAELYNESILLSNNNEAKIGYVASMMRSGDYNSVIDFTDIFLEENKSLLSLLPVKIYRIDALWKKAYVENDNSLYNLAYRESLELYSYHISENYDLSAITRSMILADEKLREDLCEYYTSFKDDIKPIILLEAINSNPNFTLGNLLMARELYSKKEYQKAVQYLNSVQDKQLSKFLLSQKYKLLALCNTNMKNYDNAFNVLKQSLDFQDNESLRNKISERMEEVMFLQYQ